MITINNISEINNLSFENFNFTVFETKIIIENKKEEIKIELTYNQNKIYPLLDKIKKLTGLKISLNNIPESEILSYIQNKGFEKTLWSPIGKAMHEFNMINEGDRVAVGISGGKDSLTLLNLLVRIQKISKVNFQIFPVHIHPVEKGGKYQEIQNYCKQFGLSLDIIETSIGETIQNNDSIKNPCFLCARLRRGILYTYMKKNNINKLALGHHKDDIIETFLLNIFYQGNSEIMKPSYFSDEYEIEVIRPLSYVEEKDIIKYSKKLSLPILKNECPYETSENSKRLKVKTLIDELSKENPNIRSVLLNSIKKLISK